LFLKWTLHDHNSEFSMELTISCTLKE
jgi:hypothetical protein